MLFYLVCSCGWTHTTTTRESATAWKAWHRMQHTQSGQRASDCGHLVKVAKETKSRG